MVVAAWRVFQLLSWLCRVLLDIDNRRSCRRSAVSSREDASASKERTSRCAFPETRFTRVESWTPHGASGDELLGVLEASSKLRNAIMSRHFCHRRWPIIEWEIGLQNFAPPVNVFRLAWDQSVSTVFVIGPLAFHRNWPGNILRKHLGLSLIKALLCRA